MSDTIDRDVLERQLRAVLEQLARLPRHPRGFQGPVVAEDMILVAKFRDPATGKLYIADPAEVEPGGGETPQSDLFLRDYATIGTKRGTSLVDIVLRIVPGIPGGGGVANIVDLFKGLFGGKR